MTNKLDMQLLDMVKRRDAARAVELLELGADANTLEPQTARTPLYYAAALDMSNPVRERLVMALIKHGAEVNKADAKGQTPLHVAAQRAGLDIMQLLLDRGADINARTLEGATPLHLAMSAALGTAKTETMQWLIDHGANSLIRDEDGKTPLDRAREMEGFAMFYATVIGFLQDWEDNKPEGRRREELTAANGGARRKAADDVLARMKQDSKRFKLKP